MRSLTDDFENIVCITEESKDLSTLSVEELIRSLETHEQQRRRRMRSLLNKHFSKATIKGEAQNTQGKGRYQGGKGNGLGGRRCGRKNRKNSLANKIGKEEVKVHGEEVGRATQMLSVSSVASMIIMQKSVTWISVSIVVRLDNLQKISV